MSEKACRSCARAAARNCSTASLGDAAPVTLLDTGDHGVSVLLLRSNGARREKDEDSY